MGNVSYAANGGTGTVPASYTKTSDYFITIASNTLTKTGYTFTGWSDGTNIVQPGSSYTIAGDTIFTAQWSVLYTITYALNNGTGTIPTQSDVASGGTFTIAPSTGITRTGYTFAGWSNGVNIYQAGSTYTMGSTAVTLTAQWSALYTVTYALNYGTGTQPTQTAVASGTTITITSNTITRTGYVFTGWRDNGGNTYQPGSSYTIGSSNVVLTAQWSASYPVTYARNGGTGVLPTQSSLASGDTFIIAESTGITKSGYTFSGWRDNGGNTYQAGSTYTTGGTPVTLTAQWVGNLATLNNLYINTGTFTPAFTAGTTSYTVSVGNNVTSIVLTPGVAQSRSIVTINGTQVNNGSSMTMDLNTGTTLVTIIVTAQDDTSNTYTLLINTNSTYTVTYTAGGATGSVPTEYGNFATGQSFIVQSPSRLAKPGSVFSTWEDQNGKSYTPNNTYRVQSEDITLTAQWISSISATAPVITGFSPTSASVIGGIQITITGYNFKSSFLSVQFPTFPYPSNAPAIQFVSDTMMIVTCPAEFSGSTLPITSSGYITVTNENGTGISTEKFTYNGIKVSGCSIL